MCTVTDGGSASLRISGAPGPRALEIHLPLSAPPGRVLVDGLPAADWRFDPARSEVVVSARLGDGEIQTEP